MDIMQIMILRLIIWLQSMKSIITFIRGSFLPNENTQEEADDIWDF